MNNPFRRQAFGIIRRNKVMAFTYLTARATQVNREARLYEMHPKRGKISLDKIIDNQVESDNIEVRLYPFLLHGDRRTQRFDDFFEVVKQTEFQGCEDYLEYELNLKTLGEIGLLKLYNMPEGTFFRINYDALDVDELTYFDFAATKALELDHNQLFAPWHWRAGVDEVCSLSSVYKLLGELYGEAQPPDKALALYKKLDKKGIPVGVCPWDYVFKDAKFGGVATAAGLRLLPPHIRGKVVAEIKLFTIELAFKGLKTVEKRFHVYEFWQDRDPLRVAGKEGKLVKVRIFEARKRRMEQSLTGAEITFDAVIDLVEKVPKRSVRALRD